jgi:hypothetical protein
MKIHITYLIPIAFLTSCIDMFYPEGVTQQEGLLVVDGVIQSGTTTIELSRTISLDAEWFRTDIDAVLYVECNDGSRFNGTSYFRDGVYKIETGELSQDKLYRLHIDMDGKAYESEYLQPLASPAIDSISWQKHAVGEPVFINVSTHNQGGDGDVSYYRWTYQEDWELKSELFAQYGQMNGWEMYFSLNTPYNIYYCWGSNRSSSFVLASTARLSTDIILNKQMIEIPPGSDKISELYHIAVSQYRIRKEAYNYFANLQKNISQTGNLFSPVPAEMDGNIRCITSPDEKVIGYVEVTTPSVKAQFMPELILAYEPPEKTCNKLISTDPNSGIIYSLGPPPLYAPARCLDCTLRGSKNKPSFWPNDHL